MATFTLDSIREAAEKKYGSTDIEIPEGTVRLLNPLRLSKEKRKALMSIQDRLDTEEKEGEEKEEVDQEEILADAIRLVAEDAKLAEKLLKAVGDDMAMLAEIFSTYTGEAQVGEASASES
jgi:NACalpha-BTF3-like transcription factor